MKAIVKTTGKDQIYAQPQVEVAGFRFDSAVADVFPDMIKRSVPGYETIIAMTGTLAEQYVQPQSRCYDLGCSLGASTLAMRHQIQHEGCEIIGVDNSEAMLQRCRQVLDRDHIDPERVQQRADNDAGDQVSQDGAQAKPRGDGNRDDAGDQKDKGEQ